MNTRIRRLVAVGLVSGSLAISAVVGAGAVGAASINDREDLVTRGVTVTVPATMAPENFGTTSVIFTQNDGREDPR